ncbi:CotH kinase family protein [Rubrivirga sp. IMCC45206]|uniref:CotH kinase family protein n=1 Tax=Rubrivirga sp. IMCC45206 TaxID=3391614 RepID=UPI0039900A98
MGLACAVAVLALGACAAAPPMALHASDLPVFEFETGGVRIPDEPKVPVRLRVVERGYRSGEPAVGYHGWAGVERRGQSSQSRYPKPQLGLELRDDDGDNRRVGLLGLPSDDDWVLHGPYGDKSLVRNALAYHLAGQMGRYAPRTRFTEVVLDGDYLGVYLLTERIEQGDDRVDIRTLKDDDRGPRSITGGYLFKIDKGDVGGWPSTIPGSNGRYPVYTPHDPKPEDLSRAQRLYLESTVAAFEETMAGPDWDDPDDGYARHLDTATFVDVFLLTELARDVDGYRVSTYYHKEHIGDGGRIRAGPVWDFNIAFGNADYYGGDRADGWQVDLVPRSRDHPIPGWWPQLAHEAAFRSAAAARWADLRRGPFHADSLDATVDVLVGRLGDAPDRNFARWPVLGRRVWPNPFVGATHAEEVAYLRRWLRERAAWMDGALAAER